MRYQRTLVRMAIIKKQKTTSVGKDVKELELLYIRGGNVKMIQPLWKTVCRFFKILKTELSYDLAIPLLGIYPKKMQTLT